MKNNDNLQLYNLNLNQALPLFLVDFSVFWDFFPCFQKKNLNHSSLLDHLD